MPVDPSAIATWANLVTVARVLIAPLGDSGVARLGAFHLELADAAARALLSSFLRGRWRARGRCGCRRVPSRDRSYRRW